MSSTAELKRTALQALTSWCHGWWCLRKMRRASREESLTRSLYGEEKSSHADASRRFNQNDVFVFVVWTGRVLALVWYQAVVVPADLQNRLRPRPHPFPGTAPKS